MDIYDYINSHDIAEYCRKIEKTWTPFEMAVLVDRSHRTIAEKHTAWREIIADCPDMETPKNEKGGSYESLHQKLAEMIDYEEYLLENFKKTEAGAVYRYDDWSGCRSVSDNRIYDNFETVLSAAMKSYKHELGRNKDHVIRITKSLFINDTDKMAAFFTHDGSPDCVWIVGSRRQSKLFLDISKKGYVFDAYIDIPMPFKRGDILTRKKGWDKEDDGIIFVFDLFDRDDPEWLEKFSNKDLCSNDESVRGFVADERGYLLDYSSPYDLEQLVYYQGKLEGKARLLHYVSLYLRNEIRLTEFLTMQNRIILEQQLDKDLSYYKLASDFPQNVTDEKCPRETV